MSLTKVTALGLPPRELVLVGLSWTCITTNFPVSAAAAGVYSWNIPRAEETVGVHTLSLLFFLAHEESL
jgi:hypothetical protein